MSGKWSSICGMENGRYRIRCLFSYHADNKNVSNSFCCLDSTFSRRCTTTDYKGARQSDLFLQMVPWGHHCPQGNGSVRNDEFYGPFWGTLLKNELDWIIGLEFCWFALLLCTKVDLSNYLYSTPHHSPLLAAIHSLLTVLRIPSAFCILICYLFSMSRCFHKMAGCMLRLVMWPTQRLWDYVDASLTGTCFTVLEDSFLSVSKS